MLLADLHVHTQCSDGTLTPADTVRAAKAAGIGVLAVCDHNTVESWPQFAAACREYGVQGITGVEIDCTCDAYNLHILALGCDVAHAGLRGLLQECRSSLDAMSDDLIAAMEQDGQPVSVAEYAAFVRNPAEGGWKGINYLGTKGFAGAYPACMELYRRYGIAPRQPWPALETVCRVIHSAKGKAIVAHPGDRLPPQPEALTRALARLHTAGIDGVECFYPSHSETLTRVCEEFCRSNGLCITCGSDSHGDFAREVDGVVYTFGAACRPVQQLVLTGISGV